MKCGDNCGGFFFLAEEKQTNLNLQLSNTEKPLTTVLQNLHWKLEHAFS